MSTKANYLTSEYLIDLRNKIDDSPEDQDLQNELGEALLLLAEKISSQFSNIYQQFRIEKEDIISIGVMVALKGFYSFDKTRNNMFAYLTTCVFNELKHAFKKEKTYFGHFCQAEEETNFRDSQISEDDI